MGVILTQVERGLCLYEPVEINTLPETPAQKIFESVLVPPAAAPLILDDYSSSKFGKKMTYRVLSLDGGGAREYMALTWLAALEKAVNIPAGQMYDLIAGTSAGAIATLALLERNPHPSERDKPLYTAQWLQQEFPAMAQKVFPDPDANTWLPVRIYHAAKTALWEIDHAKYSKAGIEDIAKTYLHGSLAKDALKPFVISTYQCCKAMKTRFITREATEKGFFGDLEKAKLLKMSSAAPTYFDPEPYKGYAFQDGGIFANDPALAGLTEAKRLYGTANNYVVTSFGTGITPTALDTLQNPSKASWGLRQVLPSLIDEFMNASEQATDSEMRVTYAEKAGYWRWQAEIPNIALDDASAATMQKLEAIALQVIKENPDSWNRMVHRMEHAINDEAHAQPVEAY